MQFSWRSKRTILMMNVAATILLAVAAILWWNNIYQSPSRVFWGMMSNNLSTTGVTKHQVQTAGNQSVDQYVRLQLGGVNAARWLVTVKQAADARVVTESIGTPQAGYVRYVDVKTSQKQDNGQKYDFSSVLNVWGKSSGQNDGQSTLLNKLFSQSVLDVGLAPMPPIGNLAPEQRQALLDYTRSNGVFATDFSKARVEAADGHRVYVYSVSVKLEPYIKMMQMFARDIGLHDLDNIDSSKYRESPDISLDFTVDMIGRQLVKVDYAAQNYEQTYSGYGLTDPIQIPSATIPIQQLQSRLQKIQ